MRFYCTMEQWHTGVWEKLEFVRVLQSAGGFGKETWTLWAVTQRIHCWHCKWGRWHHRERASVSVKPTKKLLQQSESLKTINMMYFVHWASDVPPPPHFRFALEWPFRFLNFPCELVMEVTKELKWIIFIFLLPRDAVFTFIELRWDEMRVEMHLYC